MTLVTLSLSLSLYTDDVKSEKLQRNLPGKQHPYKNVTFAS